MCLLYVVLFNKLFFLAGQEMMALQGLYMSDLRGYVPAGVTQHQIGDLAGNALLVLLAEAFGQHFHLPGCMCSMYG